MNIIYKNVIVVKPKAWCIIGDKITSEKNKVSFYKDVMKCFGFVY